MRWDEVGQWRMAYEGVEALAGGLCVMLVHWSDGIQ